MCERIYTQNTVRWKESVLNITGWINYGCLKDVVLKMALKLLNILCLFLRAFCKKKWQSDRMVGDESLLMNVVCGLKWNKILQTTNKNERHCTQNIEKFKFI